MLEDLLVPTLGQRAFERQAARLEEAVQAHHAQAHRTFAHGCIGGPRHRRFGPINIILQHIVEEAHAILDELRLVVPLVPSFDIQRRQAAHRGAIIAQMVRPGGQGDFGTQVRRRHLQPQITLVLGHGAVHFIDEDDVGLAGGQPCFHQLGEQRAGIDFGALLASLRADQIELVAVAHRFHELVGDQHAMVQVQRLAVEIARRLADFEELLDLRVRHVEIDRRRTTAQATLADGERQAVHHPHERDDAAGLAVEADRLADAAHIAPIGADAAAARGQPHILVPGANDAIQAVRYAVQIAADRQAAPGATVGQHRSRRHEPQPADVVIDALGMFGVVGIGGRHAGKKILIGFARQQITVVQRIFAEISEQRVAAAIHRHRESPRQDFAAARPRGGCRSRRGLRQHASRHARGQRGTGIGGVGGVISCGQTGAAVCHAKLAHLYSCPLIIRGEQIGVTRHLCRSNTCPRYPQAGSPCRPGVPRPEPPQLVPGWSRYAIDSATDESRRKPHCLLNGPKRHPNRLNRQRFIHRPPPCPPQRDSFPQGLVQDCCNNPGSARCGKLDAKATAAYRFPINT